MATPAQIAANRRNALLSTGPRTARGKSFSSRNRLIHGLRSRLVVLPDENPADLALLIDKYCNPRLALAIWKLERASRAEIKAFLDPATDIHRLATLAAYRGSFEREFFRALNPLPGIGFGRGPQFPLP
jgi:hypothetical protein